MSNRIVFPFLFNKFNNNNNNNKLGVVKFWEQICVNQKE